MTKRFISPLYWLKKAWLIVAIFLVLAAMAVSGARALLPYLDDYRDEIVQWMAHEYDVHLAIDSLSARWEKLGPSLSLQGLTLLDVDDSSLQLSVAEARVELDFWRTLYHRELRFKDLTLDGVRFTVDPSKSAANNQMDLDVRHTLATFFLVHLSKVELTNSELLLRQADDHWRKIEINRVSWLNRNGKHQGQGEIVLESQSQETANFVLNVAGELGNPDSLQGELYIDAQGVNFTRYLNRVLGDFYQVTSNEISAEVWVDFAWDRLVGVWVDFGENHLNWDLGGESHSLTLNGGSAKWLPLAEGGWQFASSGTQFATDGKTWKDYEVAGKYHNDKMAVSVKELDISRLLPLLTLAPVLPPEVEDPLRGLKPEGILKRFNMYVDVSQQSLHLSADVSGLGWNHWQGIPGVKGVDGRLVINPGSGHLSLQGRQLAVDVGEVFAEPLVIEQMGGVLYWLQQPGHFQLFSDRVALTTPDLGVTAGFHLDIAEQTSLSLYADTSLNDAASAYRYYPLPVMDEELVAYLTDALQGGNSQQGGLLWHGSFAEFPYSNNKGIFQAHLNLDKARFKFDPEWPALDPVDLRLMFENDGLKITSSGGDLMGTELLSLQADIPEFQDKSVLFIQASARSDGPKATALMNASPFQDPVGQVLEDLPVKGGVTAKLDLTIPLYEEDPVVAKGEVFFKNNEVTIAAAGMTLQQVNGSLSFVDSTIQMRSSTATLYGEPVRFDLDGRETGNDDYRIDASVDGHWPVSALGALWDDPRLALAQGSADWQGAVAVRSIGERILTDITVSSGLKGVSVDLPAPFDKPAEASWPMMVRLNHDGQTLRIDTEVPERYRSRVIMTDDGDDLLLDSVSVAIGNTDLPPSKNGDVQIGVKLPEFDLSPWLDQLSVLHPDKVDGVSLSAPENVNRVEFRKLRADIGRLTVSGLAFEQFNLDVTANSGVLSGQVSGDQAELDFTYANDSAVINAEYLTLMLDRQFEATDSSDKGDTDSVAEPPDEIPADGADESVVLKSHTEGTGADHDSGAGASSVDSEHAEGALLDELAATESRKLPAISLKCKRCVYDKYTLGQVVFELQPWHDGAKGMSLEALNVDAKDGKLRMQGGWRENREGQIVTQIKGTFVSKDTGETADFVGLPSLIRDATMDSSFDFSWLGFPEQYTHKNFNGTMSTNMKDGYIVDAGGGGVGIISMLSLDTLLRRLRLDFSDMFDKGLTFNSFKGNYDIESGVVSTKDLKMVGASGTMTIAGHTSLVTEELDYDVVFYPKLTASLPVLTAFAITPVTGLAVLALTQVIDPVVEVVYQVNMKIEGTMSEPKVYELDRKSKDVKMKELKKQKPEEIKDADGGSVDATGKLSDSKLAEAA
ncbi:TIGR02099 family protein [Corallincola luteus]|uniref:TIGR02099 family protein n=1 Tax=Corallincola luteus TaxID=1775177 RepID=A0ABY2AMM7_9GAMM|nr:YhdP family protein [Corallincola luteus]TCI03542.1 TIGR02099 family protein [Corallincola luteus]